MQVQLTPSSAQPQPVATTINWTATVTDTDPGPVTYRFSVALNSGPFSVVRDYSLANSFDWTPAGQEGSYRIEVTARDSTSQATAQMTVEYQITALVSGSTPVISKTGNPLVALYCAPSCPDGSSMRVRFTDEYGYYSDVTSFKPCHPPASMNFYIAGMEAGEVYTMNYEILSGSTITPGSTPLTWKTGTPTVAFPNNVALMPANWDTSLDAHVLLHSFVTLGDTPVFPVATDLQGKPIWYYAQLGDVSQKSALLTRPVAGGTMLIIANGIGSAHPEVQQQQILREIDLAGNTLRETNVSRVSEQLVAMGKDPIGAFHHDAMRLSNGDTVVLGSVERLFAPGTQGNSFGGKVDILADMVIVLDQNWQVTWAWNSFDHAGGGNQLDINRPAVLGETCRDGQSGCPPLFLTSETSTKTANDWLHGNSIDYDPTDGNLLLSFRHQDWVVKIDYRNGTGNGDVLWRLGANGDFTITSSDPYPWFSHQHDAGFEFQGAVQPDGTRILSLFDDGNTRVQSQSGGSGHSRGQVLKVDEEHRTVTLLMNADLGVYSYALGSAQRLPNGDYHFVAGLITPPLTGYSQSIELRPSGMVNFDFRTDAVTYRDFRMVNLYMLPPKLDRGLNETTNQGDSLGMPRDGSHDGGRGPDWNAGWHRR